METIQAYNERNISGIKEEDINISITGTVVNREDNGFVVDDGSQSLKVLMENSVKDNDYVRIFGKLERCYMENYLKYARLGIGIISILIALLYLINLFSEIQGLGFLFNRTFLAFIILINAVVMFYDSLKIYYDKYKILTITTAVLLFILGLLPLLIGRNYLSVFAFMATLTVNVGLMALLLFFAGLYFVLNYF